MKQTIAIIKCELKSLDEIEEILLNNKFGWIIKRNAWPFYGKAVMVFKDDTTSANVQPTSYGMTVGCYFGNYKGAMLSILKYSFTPYLIYKIVKGETLFKSWSDHNIEVEKFLKSNLKSA